MMRYALKCLNSLKAHNHLFGQFLNMSIYITNKTYTPSINLTKFEPLKPSHSGDISLLVFPISKGSCEAAMFVPKNTMFILKILIIPVYILT